MQAILNLQLLMQKKAVKINEKYNNSCATAVGKQRAQDIISNRSFSLSILKRVHGYLSRAKAYDTGQYEKRWQNNLWNS